MQNINIENATIMFRNFSGKRDKFNPGRKNFSVVIDDAKMAQELLDEGWNVKEIPIREEGDDPAWRLEVRIKFEPIKPAIWLVTKAGKTLLDEESAQLIDDAEIENVDLVIRPFEWDFNGKTGVTAYLKTMYVTIREDPFAEKYR